MKSLIVCLIRKKNTAVCNRPPRSGLSSPQLRGGHGTSFHSNIVASQKWQPLPEALICVLHTLPSLPLAKSRRTGMLAPTTARLPPLLSASFAALAAAPPTPPPPLRCPPLRPLRAAFAAAASFQRQSRRRLCKGHSQPLRSISFHCMPPPSQQPRALARCLCRRVPRA